MDAGRRATARAIALARLALRRRAFATTARRAGADSRNRGSTTLASTALGVAAAIAATRASSAGWAEDVEFALSGLATPALRALDAETAHDVGVAALALGLGPRRRRSDAAALAVDALGMRFDNPIGLAAGFDKDARAYEALMRMGFGFVEIGSVTPLAQPGNAKPRAFRLREHGAVINRYGFNSLGHESARARLASRREGDGAGEGDDAIKRTRGVLGVNLGKNKVTPEERAADDYVLGVENIGEFGDYIVVNISSPNTPGLRNLQGRKHLSGLLRKVLDARDKIRRRRRRRCW